MTYQHLPKEEKDEIFEDRCVAFGQDLIREEEFRSELGKLGYNATEIEEIVRFYRPGISYGECDGDTS